MKEKYEAENPIRAVVASNLSDVNKTVILLFVEVMFGGRLLLQYLKITVMFCYLKNITSKKSPGVKTIIKQTANTSI